MNKFWLIPLLSVILLVSVGIVGQSSYNIDISSSRKAINITDVTVDISESYDYYSGDVSGVISSTKDFNYLSGEIIFYDESGAKISNANAYILTGESISTDEKIKFTAPYFSSSKPVKAIVEIKDNMGSDPIYELEITF